MQVFKVVMYFIFSASLCIFMLCFKLCLKFILDASWDLVWEWCFQKAGEREGNEDDEIESGRTTHFSTTVICQKRKCFAFFFALTIYFKLTAFSFWFNVRFIGQIFKGKIEQILKWEGHMETKKIIEESAENMYGWVDNYGFRESQD